MIQATTWNAGSGGYLSLFRLVAARDFSTKAIVTLLITWHVLYDAGDNQNQG